MKPNLIPGLLTLGVAVALTTAGCKSSPPSTVKFGSSTSGPTDISSARPLDSDQSRPGASDINDLPNQDLYRAYRPDPEIFRAQTVHFDLDSTVVKFDEQTRVAFVADYLKGNALTALKVEGHCDDRGTEEYNRSLGERRAMALREELIRLGVNPQRVLTISFGEDRPAAEGQTEAAWSRNRRGEFVLLTPPE